MSGLIIVPTERFSVYKLKDVKYEVGRYTVTGLRCNEDTILAARTMMTNYGFVVWNGIMGDETLQSARSLMKPFLKSVRDCYNLAVSVDLLLHGLLLSLKWFLQ
jgi:hypothetical protein